MTTGRVMWGFVVWAVAALALAAPASPLLAAQQGQDCRCVDPDGNTLSDCVCFRAPRFDTWTFALGPDRPRLGIRVDAEQGSALDAQGARVTEVLRDGPAWRAGLREGDVITAIDGRSLFEPLGGDGEEDFDLDRSIPVQRLLAIARDLEPGDDVEVTYLRDGQERTATVRAEELRSPMFTPGQPFDAQRLRERLGELRELPGLPWGGTGDGNVAILRRGPATSLYVATRGARLGLEMAELNEGLGRYFGTNEGVLVLDVTEDSQLGLQPGDVILRIGDREATTPDRVLRILESYSPDEAITFRIRRDGREISVQGRMPA